MERTWLVIGGLGYLGRNFVKHLLDNDLAEYVTVADKAVPQLSNLLPMHEAAFADPRVTCVQADMARTPERAFQRAHRYIVNFAGETRKGMGEDMHEQNSLGVVRATYPFMGGSKWIEVSSAQVYADSKRPNTESSRLDPKSREGKWRLIAEQALAGRDHVILRPARVYGDGDFRGLTPLLVVGLIYKFKNEKLKSLFNADFKTNTVHVQDVSRAIVHLRELAGVYNLADPNFTTQKYLNKLVEGLFHIKTGYHSRLASLLSAETLCEAANDLHMPTWMDLCAQYGLNTPISPEMDPEDVQHLSVHVDGASIRRHGFEYMHPRPTVEVLRHQATLLSEAGLLPPF